MVWASFAAHCQPQLIDSISRQLDTTANRVQRAELMLTLAGAYRNINPYTGLDYGTQALQIARDAGDRNLRARIINEMGVLYRKADMYEQALQNHQKALSMFEQLNDRMGIAFALANIGNVYYALEQYDKAVDYNMQALRIKRQLGDPEQIAYSLRTTALALQASGDFSKASRFLHEALGIARKLNDRYSMANVYYHLGNVAFDAHKDKHEAIDYYEKALKIYNQLQSRYGTALALYEKARAHLAMHSNRESLALLQEALAHAQKAGLRKITMNIYHALSEYYRKQDDYRQALVNFERYSQIRDSLFNETSNRNIAEMQAKYNSNRQQAQIEILQKEKKLDTANQMFYILAIIFISSFGVLVFLRYRDKKTINKKLEEEIERRNMQEQKLLQSEQNLTTANATKDKFFSIISHDLKSPFGAIMGLSELLDKEFENFSQEEKKHLARDIYKATRNTYALLQDLLSWSQSQRGLIEYNPGPTWLAAICNENLEYIKPAADKKNISISCEMSPDVRVMADQHMLTTILRNLLSNAVKFTPRNGKITVTAKKTNHTPADDRQFLEVAVEDSGIGIDSRIKHKLFRIEEKFKTPGTENEPGTGLGLIICKEFVEKHGGTIRATSEKGRGSTFSFTIPEA